VNDMAEDNMVLVGVECCGTVSQRRIASPGPEEISCIVCGERHQVWA